MTKWLPTNEKNTLPNFATAYLGAGGAVIDEKNSEILLVTDKYIRSEDGKDLWVFFIEKMLMVSANSWRSN